MYVIMVEDSQSRVQSIYALVPLNELPDPNADRRKGLSIYPRVESWGFKWAGMLPKVIISFPLLRMGLFGLISRALTIA